MKLSDLKLQSQDIKNVLLQFRNDLRAWKTGVGNADQDSMFRCQRLGVLQPNSTILTILGLDYARRIEKKIKILHHGIPLEARLARCDRQINNEHWYRMRMDVDKGKTWIIASRNAVFSSSVSREFDAQLIEDEISHEFLKSIRRHIREAGPTPRELIPYAYQIDKWPNALELICLKSSSGITRISATYFDLINARYKFPRWWQKPGDINAPVIVKTGGGGPIKGAVALIMSINDRRWPDPELEN
jgi:hypothetical protein